MRTDDKKPKPMKKISEKGKIKKEEKAKETVIQFEEFQKFYDQHPTKRCFECNTYIPVCRSYSVHHCLPKQTYDDIKLDWRYWTLQCGICHNKIETCIDFAPKTKAHTEKLLALYESKKEEAKLLLLINARQCSSNDPNPIG